MCDFGITAAVVAGIGAVASATVSGVGASRTAKYQQQAMDYAAKDAKQRGEIEAKSHADRVQQILSRQRAAAAGQGFVVDAGSNLDIFTDTKLYGEYDTMTVRANAAREAAGYKTAGRLAGYEGRLGVASAAAQGTTGLLSAANDFGSAYSTFKKKP